MGDFSFRKLTYIAFVVVILVWASSIETCNARRRGKHWRQNRATLTSLYKKKGKNDHGHQASKPKQENPLPTPEEPLAPPTIGSEFNVLDYGAKGDGDTDDTKLDGTIIAPTNAKAWGKGLLQWLEFTKLVGLTIKGKGNIDGRGSVWWTKSILDDPIDNEERLVVSSYNTTLTQNPKWQVSNSLDGKMPNTKPTALRFYGSFNVTVTGITIQNSQQCHLKFDNCDGVLVYGFSVSSPGDSPNTDGIHLQNSKNVLIHTTDLACGDDCISIQTGCTNVYVHDVSCGPGHGISIGSLGKDGTIACVSNITVRNINMHNTMNGVRIKTWQGGSGLVQGVLFSNIQVSEVEFPIMIDQYYCDHSSCTNHTSAVAVSNIAYENIRGTYTVKPVHVSCSDSKPCSDIRLTDIELKPVPKGYHMYEPFCWQAFGELYAPTIPEIGCLQQGTPSTSSDPDEAECAA